jgi:ABC-type nitrate/sulfonate/bicarbonate transport system permease component
VVESADKAVVAALDEAVVDTDASSSTAGRTAASSKRQRVVLGIVGALGLLVIWEAVARFGLVDARYLPPPTIVAGEFVHQLGSSEFWIPLSQTLRTWAIGLVVVTVAGVVLGYLIGLSSFLRKYTTSTIEFLRPIPSVALIPLAVLTFGVRVESALLLIIYACFWQMLIQILYGVSDVDPVTIETARTYGLGWFARIRYVIWPSTMPYLMTGLRLSATIALVLAITAELVIGVPGLGTAITLAQNGARVTTVYALTVATGALGLLINLIMLKVEAKVLSWHASVRGEAVA